MIRVAIKDLAGPALDYAVARACGCELTTAHAHFRKCAAPVWSADTIEKSISTFDDGPRIIDAYGNVAPIPSYSTGWDHSGPLLERTPGLEIKQWLESRPESKCEVHIHNYEGDWIAFGPTMLIAAMRCYVASKFGEFVEVPEELVP